MNYLDIVQGSITTLKTIQESLAKTYRGNEVAIIETNKALMSTINFAIEIEKKESESNGKNCETK